MGTTAGQALGETGAPAKQLLEIMHWINGSLSQTRGVGGNIVARPIPDLTALFRGPAFQNLAAPFSQNLVRGHD
jgi:hypothetical protein